MKYGKGGDYFEKPLRWYPRFYFAGPAVGEGAGAAGNAVSFEAAPWSNFILTPWLLQCCGIHHSFAITPRFPIEWRLKESGYLPES